MSFPGEDYCRAFSHGWEAAIDFMRSNWPDFMDDRREGESVADTADTARQDMLKVFRS